jgi:hypothetical protein
MVGFASLRVFPFLTKTAGPKPQHRRVFEIALDQTIVDSKKKMLMNAFGERVYTTEAHFPQFSISCNNGPLFPTEAIKGLQHLAM